MLRIEKVKKKFDIYLIFIYLCAVVHKNAAVV